MLLIGMPKNDMTMIVAVVVAGLALIHRHSSKN